MEREGGGEKEMERKERVREEEGEKGVERRSGRCINRASQGSIGEQAHPHTLTLSPLLSHTV